MPKFEDWLAERGEFDASGRRLAARRDRFDDLVRPVLHGVARRRGQPLARGPRTRCSP